MPLQVLQREEAPGQNEMVASMESMRKAMAEAKQAKLYEFQLKAMARNADNEEKKMTYTRKAQFAADAMKLKEMGAGEDAIKILSSLYGDDVMPYAQEFGAELAKTKAPENPIESAIARRIGGGNAEQGNIPTAQVGVGMDGQPDTNPRIGPMVGQTARPSQQEDMLIPEYTYKGAKLVFPKDLARTEEIKEEASNRAKLKTRVLGAEEQKAATYIQSTARNANTALKELDRLGALNLKQSMAVDSEQPVFAKADVEPLQSALNNLRSVLLYLRSGAAINENEYERLRRLLQLTGKESDQQKADITEFITDANTYLDLMSKGAAALPTENTVATFGRFSIREKK